MEKKLFDFMRPTGKGVTENFFANTVFAGLAMIGSWILASIAEPRTGLGFVIMFLVSLAVLSLAFLAFAFGWRWLYPFDSAQAALSGKEEGRQLAKGITDATEPFRSRPTEDPPFLMRLVGGRDHARVDREVEGGGYDAIKFQLENARPVHVAGIEVYISGVSHHLNTLRKHTEKIPKLYLTSRRQVNYLNSSGKEEYVLLSREIHDRSDGGIRTFWGDYKFTPDEQRLDAYAHENAVHIVEITVTSPTTPLFTCSLKVIVTDKREQILPIDPKGNGWGRSV